MSDIVNINSKPSKAKTSKVNPLNKVKLDSLDSMDMGIAKGIEKSKSNSLKRLDEIDNKQHSKDQTRLDKAKEILNVAHQPSESELKALDLDKEHKLKELKRQFDQEINQYSNSLEDNLMKKVQEIQKDLDRKYKQKNTDKVEDSLNKDISEIDTEYSNKLKSFRLQKERDYNDFNSTIDSEIKTKQNEVKRKKDLIEKK